MNILMSRENPGGHRLEELLAQMRCEVLLKTAKIETDTTEVAGILRTNNAKIIDHLHEAEKLQRESYAELAKIAPDSGPTGTPRVGDRRYEEREAQHISASDVGSVGEILGEVNAAR